MKYNKRYKEHICNLYKSGKMTLPELAERHRLPKSTIYYWLESLEIEIKPKKTKDINEFMVISHYDSGLSMIDTAKAMGVSKWTIERVFKDLGKKARTTGEAANMRSNARIIAEVKQEIIKEKAG